MYAATIIIYCNPQAAATATSTSDILQMIDRRSSWLPGDVFSPAGKSDDVPCISSVGKLADLPASGAAALSTALYVPWCTLTTAY